MLVFIFAPPLWLGAMAILLLGLGLLSAAGTVVTYFANRARIPLLTLLMIWAVTISAFNDNHLVRPYAGAHSHAVVTQAPPPTAHGTPLPDASLGGYFERWWTDLDKTTPGMAPMLRRLLGHNIELLLLTTPGLGRIQADPSQIEQAIVSALCAANAENCAVKQAHVLQALQQTRPLSLRQKTF